MNIPFWTAGECVLSSGLGWFSVCLLRFLSCFNTYACVLFSSSAFTAQSAEHGQHFSPREPRYLLLTPPRPFSTFFFFFVFSPCKTNPSAQQNWRENREMELNPSDASSRDGRRLSLVLQGHCEYHNKLWQGSNHNKYVMIWRSVHPAKANIYWVKSDSERLEWIIECNIWIYTLDMFTSIHSVKGEQIIVRLRKWF